MLTPILGHILKNTETHVHKITNAHVLLYDAGINDFDASKFITRAIGRGGSTKIETILGPELATNEASVIFRVHPFQWTLK
jgi:hypothetical protein